MSLPVKVEFQSSEGKLTSREFKVDPLTPCLSLKIEASKSFGILDHKSYSLYHKRQLLPSYLSIKESSVSPGTTLNLVQKSGLSAQSKQVSLSVRFNDSGKMVKASGTFPLDASFLEAMQSLHDGSNYFNALQSRPFTLPVLLIATATFDWKLLIELQDYTFQDLDISGNQMFSLQVKKAGSLEIEAFQRVLKSKSADIDQSRGIAKSPKLDATADVKLTALESKSSELETKIISICKPAASSEVKFTVLKPSSSTESAPDLPDSFYDLTSEELKLFQFAYKSKVRAITERPLVSAKYQQSQIVSVAKESVCLKFVFPDRMCITSVFMSTATASDLYTFLKDNIFTDDVQFSLYYGPPMVQLPPSDKSLVQHGIIVDSRIIVNCANCTYRIKFEA